MSETPDRILPRRMTPDGWCVLTIHYSAVPEYNFHAACHGMTDEAIRQELEVDWSATKGKRVYPQFGRRLHVAVEPIAFDPRLPLYCGWDWGGTPAFVPTQLNRLQQWVIFPSVSPVEEETIGVYEFAGVVADHLYRKYAQPHNLDLKQLKLIHIGDPAGAARPPRTLDSPKEMRSCFDILKKGIEVPIGVDEAGKPMFRRRPGWGWNVIPGAVNITDRLEAVRSRLTMTLKDGIPALICDPNATVVIEGFLGAYNYKQRADGHYDWDPDKNYWSHTMDALGYIATRLFAQPVRDDEEEDDGLLHRPRFRSHASGRGW